MSNNDRPTSYYRRPLQQKQRTATIPNVEIEGDLLSALDRWIWAQTPPPGRSDIVRAVLTEWLVDKGAMSQDDASGASVQVGPQPKRSGSRGS